jgi:hypothetical protein
MRSAALALLALGSAEVGFGAPPGPVPITGKCELERQSDTSALLYCSGGPANLTAEVSRFCQETRAKGIACPSCAFRGPPSALPTNVNPANGATMPGAGVGHPAPAASGRVPTATVFCTPATAPAGVNPANGARAPTR